MQIEMQAKGPCLWSWLLRGRMLCCWCGDSLCIHNCKCSVWSLHACRLSWTCPLLALLIYVHLVATTYNVQATPESRQWRADVASLSPGRTACRTQAWPLARNEEDELGLHVMDGCSYHDQAQADLTKVNNNILPNCQAIWGETAVFHLSLCSTYFSIYFTKININK